ncbi:MAG: hypothetical protein IKN04_15805 [Clostridia bacterium]|nr:hypothetical protein [Clostridia bacterium]MBR6186208.1 hypothetical protein [Clostridia bacterium]
MRNLITQIIFVLRKHFFRILMFSIVFVAAFCIYFYVQSHQKASAILTFTYPNASEGLYPNGTYFNAYNIFTDEVIEDAIRNAGLEGNVNPRNLMNEISIRPRNNASLIATQFIVSYEAGQNDNLGAVSANGLLNSLIYSYIGHFHEIYSNDQFVLIFNVDNDENLEYLDLINYYNMSLNQMQKYLSSQQSSDKDFISSDGISFQDLINIIERYRISTLKEIKSIISERGVTSDQGTYMERLNYRIQNLTNNYDYNRKLQKLYKKILQDYESRLTSVVFIPSLDSERKFYMSKTKIGIDILALNATTYEESSEEIQRQINQTEQFIAMIKNKENTSMSISNTARVDNLIAEMKSQLEATMNTIRKVEKEFSQYKNHSYVTMMPLEISLMERTKAKSVVMLTAVMDALLVGILVFHNKKKGIEAK